MEHEKKCCQGCKNGTSGPEKTCAAKRMVKAIEKAAEKNNESIKQKL